MSLFVIRLSLSAMLVLIAATKFSGFPSLFLLFILLIAKPKFIAIVWWISEDRAIILYPLSGFWWCLRGVRNISGFTRITIHTLYYDLNSHNFDLFFHPYNSLYFKVYSKFLRVSMDDIIPDALEKINFKYSQTITIFKF